MPQYFKENGYQTNLVFQISKPTLYKYVKQVKENSGLK